MSSSDHNRSTAGGVSSPPNGYDTATRFVCGRCGAQSRREYVPAGALVDSRREVKRLRFALEEIVSILGTGACPVNKCEGCRTEMQEAAGLASEALGSSETDR